MAKESRDLSFTKATITFEEDGRILITEYQKDNVKSYDLVECLKKYDNVDGINLKISQSSELAA